jgi:ubiquilin
MPTHFFCLRSNPERLRGMLQMTSMLRNMQGGGGGGGGFGASPFAPPPSFPAPGAPGQQPSTTTPSSTTTPASTTSPSNTANPASPGTTGTGTANQFNPFGMDPALMQQMLFGGSGGLGGGGLGGMGSPPPPADTRPPEERFQVQLQVSVYYCFPIGSLISTNYY